MRKMILFFVFGIAMGNSYSQDKNEAYYLRRSEQHTAAGKFHSYQIMHFSDSNVDLIYINVQGKIGNPLTTTFIIDSCYKYVGKMNGLDSGYLSINDERKRTFYIKKRSDRKLKVDLNGVVLSYKRISETVNFLLLLESFCGCRPITRAANR
jgi:hypothetical protein